jgi:2-polyprenyl-3-methyl-5-hydroxy-6-metoxy-1,4-benzoquinol methylase
MLERRAQQEELMDDPALDSDTYSAVLTDLAQVNTLTMARRPTLAFLKSAIGPVKRFRLLDVGYGDGDMLRAIASWAASRGIEAELVGIDLNPRSEAVARAATDPALPIRYQTGDYDDLSVEPLDFIISSLVAHHMTQDQLIIFLRFMDKHARKGWFVNDLHRHGFAWCGYWLLSRLMMWHPIVRHDGQLSIARSYRPGEWPALLKEAEVTDAQIFRAFPFRLCVSKIR